VLAKLLEYPRIGLAGSPQAETEDEAGAVEEAVMMIRFKGDSVDSTRMMTEN
jgi:hypothetical protein